MSVTAPWTLRRLASVERGDVEQLADVILDCVRGGASIGFLDSFTREQAVVFWERVSKAVRERRRAILIAEDDRGICGTVQLVLDMADNQPHRADLVKMMVHSRARRKGLGEALMRGAEAMAVEEGRTLLVLDAVTGGDAARLYERLGWVRAGDVPNFAVFPDGRPCGTTFFYRDLRGAR